MAETAGPPGRVNLRLRSSTWLSSGRMSSGEPEALSLRACQRALEGPGPFGRLAASARCRAALTRQSLEASGLDDVTRNH